MFVFYCLFGGLFVCWYSVLMAGYDLREICNFSASFNSGNKSDIVAELTYISCSNYFISQ